MEERVARLEEDIRRLQATKDQLLIANAELSSSVRHLTETVKLLNTTVGTLRDMMNQGRGALWLGVVTAGAFGALLTTIIKKLLAGIG